MVPWSATEQSRVAQVVSATRMHLPAEAAEIPKVTQDHLRKYVRGVQQLGVVAAIAVNSHEESVRAICEEEAPGFKVHVLPVPYWGAFVPALNALLNFAQKRGMKYILYQSLEVRCSPEILQRLLDHHQSDVLMVGPVFSGHEFQPGEQPLNGRSVPWNTLALWSVRKLALTGFLCIADGLSNPQPATDKAARASIMSNPQEESDDDLMGPMGSDEWWTRKVTKGEDVSSVPAGVEEVTAVALLQHLHGRDKARSVLVRLPSSLEADLSWETSWDKDERRTEWHKHKMQTKVTRPAAQLKKLFAVQHDTASVGGFTSRFFGKRPETEQSTQTTTSSAEAKGDSSTYYGTVFHYGDSIAPSFKVKTICLASCGLFYTNSTAVLASAFRQLNAPSTPSLSEMILLAIIIGGVYIPMPVSLWLTRKVTHRNAHYAGLLMFGGFLLAGQMISILSQYLYLESHWLLLAARLLQGMGSGVLFLVRFMLSSVSTSDHHLSLLSWTFLSGDLGLGVGALLPAATAWLAGSSELRTETQFWLSIVLMLMTLAYLLCVLWVFPRRLPLLSQRVRFPSKLGLASSSRAPSKSLAKDDGSRQQRIRFYFSGTTRVFIQSAILPCVALIMRDAQLTGNFRQTLAVAAICLIALPFEAFSSRICCSCSARARPEDAESSSRLFLGSFGALALLTASSAPRRLMGDTGDVAQLLPRICELSSLMIVLGLVAPLSAIRLNQLPDAERVTVILEWMKAYVGRLLGPTFTVLIYNWLGYGTVLTILCCATIGVAVTA